MSNEGERAMSDSPITWFELQVPDMGQAKSFYGEVFGWTFQPLGEGFEAAFAGDQMVGGLDQSAGDASPAGRHVRIYFDVSDLEETLAKVEKAGGDVVQPRTKISDENGWFATVADPSGLKFSLWTGTEAKA
jgi:uncharacterized protein